MNAPSAGARDLGQEVFASSFLVSLLLPLSSLPNGLGCFAPELCAAPFD